MKDQYFGDVNDFRKYGLLRALVLPNKLRLGVCWMLTEPDHGADGNFLAYLSQGDRYRHRDPELFDWLKQVTLVELDRRTARMEEFSAPWAPRLFIPKSSQIAYESGPTISPSTPGALADATWYSSIRIMVWRPSRRCVDARTPKNTSIGMKFQIPSVEGPRC
jgi:hypothetical protein